MIKEAWKVISAESRAAFAADFKKCLRPTIPTDKARNELFRQIIIDLCHATKTVESKWLRMPNEVAATFLGIAWAKCRPTSIERILKAVILESRFNYLEALYRCLGVTTDSLHDMEDSVSDSIGTRDRFHEANERLESEDGMGRDDRLLLFACISDAGILAWRQGAAQVAAQLIIEFDENKSIVIKTDAPKNQQNQIAVSIATPGNSSTDNADDNCIEEDEQEPNEATPPLNKKRLRQTSFDRLLIDEAIRNVKRESLEQAHNNMSALVEETVKMDPRRIQTLFHFGFIDAMCEKPTSKQNPGDNQPRRSWYLAGYLLGFMRTHQADDVARWFVSLGIEDREVMVFQDENGAVELIGKPLLDCLSKAGDYEAFGRTASQLSQSWPQAFFNHLELLVEQISIPNFKAARVLVRQLDINIIRRFLSEEDAEIFEARHEYILAEIERGEGLFAQAALHYREAIRIDKGNKFLSNLPVGLILCELEVSSIEEIVITEARHHLWGSVLSRRHLDIEAGRANDWESSDFKFLAAMHDLLGCQPYVYEAVEVGHSIREVLENKKMADDRSEHSIDIAARFQAYAALADLLRSVELRADSSARILGQWVDTVREDQLPPLGYLKRALETATICEVDSANDLAQSILRRFGRRAVKEFPVSDLCRQSLVVAKLVLEQIRPDGAGLSPKERYETARELLKSILKSDRQDISDIGNNVFDLMYEIARSEKLLNTNFASFVRSSGESLGRIMDLDTRLYAILSVAKAAGDSDLLAGTAITLMSEAQVRGDNSFLRDLLEIVQECNAVDRVPAHFIHRLDEAAQEVQPHNTGQIDGAGICIAFVGGDERQKGYEAEISASLRKKFPKLKFWFHYPGWTSNWNRHLEEIDSKIRREKPSVLVLSPFIRTLFGRTLRSKLGEMDIQWRACTGKGRESIQLAMEAALDVAAGHNLRMNSTP